MSPAIPSPPLGDQGPAPGPPARADVERLRTAIRALIAIDICFSVVFIVVALAFHDIALAVFTVPVVATGFTLVGVNRALATGGAGRAASRVANVFLAVSVCGVLVHASWVATMSVLPLMGLALLLPYARDDQLNRYLGASVLVVGFVAVAPGLLGAWSRLPDELLRLLGIAHLVTAVLFTAFLLVQSRRRLVEGAEAERAEQARLTAVFAGIRDAVLVVDDDGVITRFNPAAGRLVAGADPGFVDLLGRRLSDVLVSPAGQPSPWADDEREEVTLAADTVARTLDGRRVELAGTVAPLRSGRGRVVVLRDASVERAAQQAEVQAAERRLQERQARLVANFAHDVRAPVGAITGFVQLMSDPRLGALNEAHAQMLSDIRGSAVHLHQLAEQYLDFSRAQAGPSLRLSRVDVRSVAEEALTIAAGAGPEHGLSITLDVAPGAEHVTADPGAMRQILVNLVGNAVAHTPPPGDVAVRVMPRDEGPGVRIEVLDSGPGVEPAQAARLFEPFERGAARRVEGAGPGSGLGLSIVQQLVHQHDGEVGCGPPSDWGGARFWVLLPDAPGKLEPVRPPAKPDLETDPDPQSARTSSPALPRPTSQLLGLAVESLAEIVEITDPDGRLAYVNPSFERLTGYSASEVLGKTPREVLRSDVHPDAYFEQIWEQLSEGRPWRGPITSRRKDGSLLPQQAVISPVLDAQGAVTHLVAVKRDCSDRVAHEADLLQVERLAAGVAHEINNPLGVVLGEVALLERARSQDGGVGDAELDASLQRVQAAAWRVRDVVRDLQLFGRHRPGEGRELQMASLDACALLDFCIDNVGHLAAGRAQIVRNYETLPRLVGDRAALSLAFQHLLVNACQATPPGDDSTNRIRVSAREAGPGRVAITIEDTGSGLSDRVRRRAFQPFFTTRAEEGHRGMGLTVARSTILDHEGTIALSDTGNGTRVEVELPALKRTITSVDMPAVRPPEQAPVAKRRILAIDDDRIQLKIIETTLRSHEVTTCSDGSEALELLAEQVFDVIVCDIMMPGINGMELYETVQQRWPASAERFIFVTGGTTIPEVRDFLRSVTRPVIGKPFRLHTLEELVASIPPQLP